MLQTLKLLLPALTPSWRFFDSVGPSPRIEFALSPSPHDLPADWREFRPRPAVLTVREMLGRLFWNPVWNETLFLTTCAERLLERPTEHSRQQIHETIAGDLPGDALPWLRFRLVFVSRRDALLERQIAYVSPPFPTKRPA